jgi:multisubunit Na+/H+ antiporter MnhF subunit
MACMLCIALAPAAWGLGAIFVYQVLLGFSSPGTFAISQILAGPNAAARWVGIQNALANVAGMVAPLLTGELVQRTHHYTSAFVVAALINVLGVFAWVRMVGRVAPVRWAGSPGASAHNAPLLENSAP